MWLSDEGGAAAVQWLQQINRFLSQASWYAQQEFTLRQRLQMRRATIAKLFGQAQIFAIEARLKEYEASHDDVVVVMRIFVRRLYDLISTEIAQQDPLYAELLVAIAQCKAAQLRFAWCAGASVAIQRNIIDILGSNENIDYAAVNKSLQKLGVAAHGAEVLLEGFMENTATAVGMADAAQGLRLQASSARIGTMLPVLTTEDLEGVLGALQRSRVAAAEVVQTLAGIHEKLELRQLQQVQSVRNDLELLYK